MQAFKPKLRLLERLGEDATFADLRNGANVKGLPRACREISRWAASVRLERRRQIQADFGLDGTCSLFHYCLVPNAFFIFGFAQLSKYAWLACPEDPSTSGALTK